MQGYVSGMFDCTRLKRIDFSKKHLTIIITYLNNQNRESLFFVYITSMESRGVPIPFSKNR